MHNLNKLFNDIGVGSQSNPGLFLIQGGYFETNYGSDDFAVQSLKSALELGRIIANACKLNKITYSILVNDFGKSCGENTCELIAPVPNHIIDPMQEIASLTKQADAEYVNFLVVKETTLKNRGLRTIRKMLNDTDESTKGISLIYPKPETTNWYLRSKFGHEISIFEKREDNLIAKCPVIMGTYYADMLQHIEKQNANTSMPVVIIDFCAYSDKDKVNRGVEVAFRLFNSKLSCSREYHIMPVLSDMDCERLLLTKFNYSQFEDVNKSKACR